MMPIVREERLSLWYSMAYLLIGEMNLITLYEGEGKSIKNFVITFLIPGPY